MVMRAGEEGVAAFDPVDEAVFHQKIERAIDRDRRRPRHRFGEFVDHLIGPERTVARQQRLQHLTSDPGEFPESIAILSDALQKSAFYFLFNSWHVMFNV